MDTVNQNNFMMSSIDLKKINYFFNFFAILISLSLFVVGRFGFFDILGLKRIMEVILFIPIGILGSLLILQKSALWKNPFFLLPFLYFLFQLFWNPNILDLADSIISMLIVGTVLSLGPYFSDLLLKNIIKIACFFAILGIIEFFILLIYPSLVSNILLFYDNYSASSIPVIQNFLQLLGLSDGTSYHLWGMAVTRLRSFTSEPSLLVGYFLVPGALGLTLGGKHAFYGMICICFCICSLAGSVYATLAFSLISIVVVLIKSQRFSMIFPFIILTFFIWLLFHHYNELILLSKTSNGGYDFLDKTNSANMRFGYIRDFIPKIIRSPFGLDEEVFQPLGFILRSAARSGFIGGAFAFIIFIKLYSQLGYVLVKIHARRMQKIGFLIIYGSLIAGLLYLDNCFIQIYGFTLLILIHNRLKNFLVDSINIRGKLDIK